jgi:molecular chaperone GrpE (heat shock protein)
MKIPLTGRTLIRTNKLDDLQAEFAALQHKTAELEKELAVVRETARDNTGNRADGGVGTPSPPKVVHELIRVTDGLTDLIEGGAAQEPERATTALDWLHRRVEALLVSCDVTRIDDSGPVDLLRQEVVDSRPTPTADLVDQIADTVRPGYSWHGSLIRPQQVVAYIPAEEARGR